MTKPFSLPYKQKMVERLTGADATSARQLERETGISQETLSRWLREARSLPDVSSKKRQAKKTWTIDEKIRVLAESAKLTGTALTGYLEREGLIFGELEQWRLALGDEASASVAATKRMRKLERELARKEKALAEAAALLVLKKKVEHLWEGEDDDTDEENDKRSSPRSGKLSQLERVSRRLASCSGSRRGLSGAGDAILTRMMRGTGHTGRPTTLSRRSSKRASLL